MMMKHWNQRFNKLFPLLVILIVTGVSALEGQNKIIIGETVKLTSNVLNEERTLFVHLPDGYAQGKDAYPVLYLLDGETHFLHVTGLVQVLASSQHIPPMIVIGITNTDRIRDFSLKPFPDYPTSGGGDKFLQFIEAELVPFVEKNYRTTPFRILAGHSLCGSFTIYALLGRPNLFQAGIAVSPGEPTNKAELSVLWDFAEKLPASNAAVKKSLHFSVGDREEATQIFYVAHLAETLRQRPRQDLTWSYEVTAGDTHSSLVHKTIENGLDFIFRQWAIPDEVLFQGLEAVKKHYALFGYLAPPESVVNTAAYRLLSLNEPAKAIPIFSWNVEMHPRSANTYDSLAEAHERNGQSDLALQNYEKACRIAQETNDPRLELFKANYESFLKRKSIKK
jgi:predicted alpha/beta superfamily hydrolase